MALVTRVLWHKHSKPTSVEMHVKDGNDEHHHQLSKISASWKRIFASKQDQGSGRWVPILSTVLKAGDEGIFPSALFTNPQGHPGEIPLQVLYEVFAEELRQRPMTERSTYPGEISKFLSTTKRATIGPKRTQSLSRRTTGRLDGHTKNQRKSLDISVAEKGFARSMSVKRPVPLLVAMRNGWSAVDGDGVPQTSWMREGRIADSRSGSIRVDITPSELIALSIVLGSPLTINGATDIAPTQTGAFNISICQSMAEDGKHQIKLRQHKRSISHMPARGSGFSPLFAKHIAAGSLPYSQDKNVVKSIFVTTDTLRAVQAGSSTCLQKSKTKTPHSRLLASLPNSREVSLQATSVSTESLSADPLIEAISALPFLGGLVPLASLPLINTVRFVACGDIPPGRLLQRLEGLVDKVNRHAPHLNIFGPLYEPHHAALLYRERERLGKLATGVNTTDSIADKAARMQRYTTLIERLMALIPGSKPQEIMADVQEATRREIYRSYADAVAGHQDTSSIEPLVLYSHTAVLDARIKRRSTQSYNRSNRSSDASTMGLASPRSSAGFPTLNLGKQVEQILKAELPLSVEAVAVVARMVIVAWTLSVEVVAWEEGEQGFRIPDLNELPDKMVMC